MSKTREIEVEISSDGDKVSLHIKGIKGKECVDASKLIEEGIGSIIDREYTTEYRQVPEKRTVNVGFNRS